MIDPAKIAKRALMQERGCKDCLYYDPKNQDCSLGMSHCILFMDRRADSSGRFAFDKPKYCRNCYWWNRRSASCRRGGLERCAYLLWEQPKKPGAERLKMYMTMLSGIPEMSKPVTEINPGTGTEPDFISQNPDQPETIPCKDCPYGKERPCVSFCMRKILQEWRAEKISGRKEAAVYA